MKTKIPHRAIHYYELRRSACLSQTDLAQFMDLARSTISKREKGATKISNEAMFALHYLEESMRSRYTPEDLAKFKATRKQ